MTLVRYLATVSLWAMASACAVQPAVVLDENPSDIYIEGVVIRNGLAYTVSDVLIQVPATGGFAGCGNILPRTACSNTFPEIDYKANPVMISWTEHGVAHETDEFIIEVPEDFSAGDSAWIEVIIFAPGQAGAQLARP